MLEVLVAAVLLGLVAVVYTRTTLFAQKNVTRGIDWQAEASAIEKAVENLRVGHSINRLQTIDSSWTDTTQGTLRIQVHVKGAVPPPDVVGGMAALQVARIDVVARRTSWPDSLMISTYVWVN